MGMLEPVEREELGDRLREQTSALALCVLELMESLGEMAGRVAETEDEVVRVHQKIAQNGVSGVAAQALEHAQRARCFAQHERDEQQKWSARVMTEGLTVRDRFR